MEWDLAGATKGIERPRYIVIHQTAVEHKAELSRDRTWNKARTSPGYTIYLKELANSDKGNTIYIKELANSDKGYTIYLKELANSDKGYTIYLKELANSDKSIYLRF